VGDLGDGQHRNQTGNLQYFTDAFFHRHGPQELSREFLDAGFEVVASAAREGAEWLARHLDRLWSEPAQPGRLLAWVRKVEQEPSILGASAHSMAIRRK